MLIVSGRIEAEILLVPQNSPSFLRHSLVVAPNGSRTGHDFTTVDQNAVPRRYLPMEHLRCSSTCVHNAIAIVQADRSQHQFRWDGRNSRCAIPSDALVLAYRLLIDVNSQLGCGALCRYVVAIVLKAIIHTRQTPFIVKSSECSRFDGDRCSR